MNLEDHLINKILSYRGPTPSAHALSKYVKKYEEKGRVCSFAHFVEECVDYEKVMKYPRTYPRLDDNLLAYVGRVDPLQRAILDMQCDTRTLRYARFERSKG